MDARADRRNRAPVAPGIPLRALRKRLRRTGELPGTAREAFVRRYVVDLALGLKAAIMLLNPRRVVIGGGIAKTGDRLFVPLREELGRQITDWSNARIDIAPSALGDDSVLFGALTLAHGE